MKNFFAEFQEFAMRGNMIDMAVGIIIGAAFTSIVNSIVNDIIMPVIGLAIGQVNFTDLFLVLKEGQTPAPYATLESAQSAGAVTLNYGLFINNLITFLIIAFVVFLLVRSVNQLRSSVTAEADAEEDKPSTKDCPYCYSTIPIQATRCPNCTSEL